MRLKLATMSTQKKKPLRRERLKNSRTRESDKGSFERSEENPQHQPNYCLEIRKAPLSHTRFIY